MQTAESRDFRVISPTHAVNGNGTQRQPAAECGTGLTQKLTQRFRLPPPVQSCGGNDEKRAGIGEENVYPALFSSAVWRLLTSGRHMRQTLPCSKINVTRPVPGKSWPLSRMGWQFSTPQPLPPTVHALDLQGDPTNHPADSQMEMQPMRFPRGPTQKSALTIRKMICG